MSDILVTPELKSAIGRTIDERSGVVYRKEFQRWAAAVGDLNPLYFQEEQAKANGYRDVIMPPMFLGQLMNAVTFLGDLRPDGIPATGDLDIPLPERRMMGGEETWFYAPVYPDDVLTATRKLANIEEKHGRSGAFVLVKWETTYFNQHRDLVAKTLWSMIAR